MNWTLSSGSIQADGSYLVKVVLEDETPLEIVLPNVPQDIMAAIQAEIDAEFGAVEIEGENGAIITA